MQEYTVCGNRVAAGDCGWCTCVAINTVNSWRSMQFIVHQFGANDIQLRPKELYRRKEKQSRIRSPALGNDRILPLQTSLVVDCDTT